MVEIQKVLVLLVASWLYCDAAYDKSELYKALLSNYEKEVEPPLAQQGSNISVVTQMMLFCATPLSDYVSIETWTRMSWRDERLRWDSSDYGGVDTLHISPSRIWKPDLGLYNAVKTDVAEVMAVVQNSGDVMWIPPVNYLVRCVHDNDSTTNCKLKFGSWTYSGRALDFIKPEWGEFLYSNVTDACPSVVQSHWAGRNVIYYEGFEEGYVDITIILKLAWR